MAILSLSGLFDNRGLRRSITMGPLFRVGPISLTWNVYTDDLRVGSFSSIVTLGPDTIGSLAGNFFACAIDNGTPGLWMFSVDGFDYKGNAPSAGKWYRQGLSHWQDGTTYRWKFYPDLPKTDVITNSNTGIWSSHHATSALVLGHSAWVGDEGVNGRLCNLKIWQGATLSHGELAREAMSPWPVHRKYLDNLWSCVPCLSYAGGGRGAFDLAGRDYWSLRHMEIQNSALPGNPPTAIAHAPSVMTLPPWFADRRGDYDANAVAGGAVGETFGFYRRR